MSAGEKRKRERGVLTVHGDWPHSLQLPTTDSTWQDRPDFVWRSQIWPGSTVSAGRDLPSHRNRPANVGPVPFPAHRVRLLRYTVKSPSCPSRGLASVLLALRCCILLKLALLPLNSLEIAQVLEWTAM